MIATGILAQLSDPTRPTTLPIAIPASLASSYALGANTVAAIAILMGYDENFDQVRTFVLLSLYQFP
jgi:hypothetical protein